ncbi:hypothetical protein P3T76_016405 [Phytophthora citrophthora]|uniref:Uncharacterized protein n=1 Tax=Phytophthora citrophthora TaxID=4793 RepID=A0AAD9FXL1_9STRA|nr:hypothetical protein P3T76_016405 [Phytophthora citrophthora]
MGKRMVALYFSLDRQVQLDARSEGEESPLSCSPGRLGASSNAPMTRAALTASLMAHDQDSWGTLLRGKSRCPHFQ